MLDKIIKSCKYVANNSKSVYRVMQRLGIYRRTPRFKEQYK